MLRSVLSVAAGTIIWTVLWLSTNAALAAALPEGIFREDGTTDSAGVLLVILAASVLFSVVAGYATATLARSAEIKHALALGVLQLAIGVFVQLQYWDVMPLWYHVSFLGLLLPGNVFGGRLRLQRKLRVQAA